MWKSGLGAWTMVAAAAAGRLGLLFVIVHGYGVWFLSMGDILSLCYVLPGVLSPWVLLLPTSFTLCQYWYGKKSL